LHSVFSFFWISNFFINKDSQGRKLSAKENTYLQLYRRMFIAGWSFTHSLPFWQSPIFISADKVECEFPSWNLDISPFPPFSFIYEYILPYFYAAQSQSEILVLPDWNWEKHAAECRTMHFQIASTWIMPSSINECRPCLKQRHLDVRHDLNLDIFITSLVFVSYFTNS
jgi:hypothetical protein